MKVINIDIVEPNKRERISGGLYIEFKTSENIIIDTLVYFVFNNKNYYFEVKNINVDENFFKLKAKEVGYWDDSLTKQKIDLRNIIGSDLYIVTDKKIIDDINLRSLWC